MRLHPLFAISPLFLYAIGAAASPVRVPADLTTDLEGNPPQIDTVDMGAYESSTSAPACFTHVAPGLGLPAVQSGTSDWGDYDNDGDLDILLTGFHDSAWMARVYRSSGGPNPTFSIGSWLDGSSNPAAAWGDYDNDGDLDIALTRSDGSSRVYRNSGGADLNTFTDIGAALPSAERGSVAWGDYDNDGDLDLLLTGLDGVMPITRLYSNSGGASPTFSDVGAGLADVNFSSVAWGDYDNDGDLDILLTGSYGATRVAKVYRNNAGVSPPFTDIGAGLPEVTGSVAWGDYDNDGDLDILLNGSVYRNSGGANPTFSDIGAGLPVTGSVAWGDYDNDGDLDILLVGGVSRVYGNSGGANPTFSDIGAGLPGASNGSVAWGDFDNDDDLDILLTGSQGTRVYRNGCATLANTPPKSPTNLSASAGAVTTFTWTASTDVQTPSAALHYNLRVGTTPGGSEFVSPMANGATGYRRIAALGNANHNTSWEVTLPGPGTYYWSVQALDGAFAGSAFADEQTVAVPVDVADDHAAITGPTLSIRGANPFSSTTTIQLSHPASGWVSLAVYDIAGRRVRTLVNESLPAGRSTTSWDGKDESGRSVSSGVYFLQMKTNAVVKLQKISLVR